MKTFREDLQEAATIVALERPTFERFEMLALTGSHDAFDESMRRAARGQGPDTDVTRNGRMLLQATNEVIGVLGREGATVTESLESNAAALAGSDVNGGAVNP